MPSTLTRETAGSSYVNEVIAQTVARNPAEPEFHQAVKEVLESLAPVFDRRPEYRSARILERMVEPERVIMFRVPWLDDHGRVQVNRGFRIEMNSALGPVQGRPALSSVGQSRHPEVPRVRTGAQELAHDAHDGRRQGRLGFRSEGQERQRSHALLPELHDRARAPHRSGHRRAGRRHRRRRPRNRLPVRPVQAAAQRVHGRADGQGPQLGRLADPSGSDRLRRGVFRGRDAGDAQRIARRARPASSPAAATSRSTPSRS